MSLNFSSPLFLFGLLGISAPVLIHFLTRRQQKHIRFSAVYLLLQSQKRPVKKSRPNRVLLLLLRCLGIALFSLALADPFFSSGDSEAFRNESPVSFLFIMDDSFSMRSQEKGKTLFASSIEFLTKLLAQIPEGSEFSLVLASSPARIEQAWIPQKESFVKLVRGLRPSYQTTDIGHALETASGLFNRSNHKDKKLVLLTDLRKNGWEKEALSEIRHLSNIPFQIFDFSALASKQNQAAVENVEVRREFLARGQILKIKAEIKNYSQENKRMPVSLILGKKTEKETLANIPGGQTVSKEFSIPLRKTGLVIGEIKIPEDALPTDNVRYFSHYPNQNIKVLVVDGDPGAVAHQSESFYLERALNPFSASVSHIDPAVSTLAELPLRNLSDYSVVILANVRELPLDFELKLENFVLRGGALIFGMGDQIDAKYYNEKLGRLLPVALEAVQKFEKTHLLFKNNNHPVMRAFSAKTIEEMKGIPFFLTYSARPRDGKTFKVANWFANQTPAVVETDMGKGKVIVFLSSLDREWNDFPIQPTFLPWVQRWTQYASRGLKNISRQNLLVGESFQQNIDPPEAAAWAIKTPGGKLSLAQTTDGKAAFGQTHSPGVYSIFELPDGNIPETLTKLPAGSKPVGAFAVNIDTRESSPRKITEEDIKNLLPRMDIAVKTPELKTSTLSSSEGAPLATPLLLAVAGILLLEGWMVRKE